MFKHRHHFKLSTELTTTSKIVLECTNPKRKCSKVLEADRARYLAEVAVENVLAFA